MPPGNRRWRTRLGAWRNLWLSEPPPVGHALELLLGRGRAAVLMSWSRHRPGGDRTAVVANGVSEHLAGLVESQRRGRFVYYRLSGTGLALLELLDTQNHPHRKTDLEWAHERVGARV